MAEVEVNKKWHLSEFQYDEKFGVYVIPGKGKYIIDYSDGAKVESYILNVIKGAKDVSDNSEELMRAVKDWPSYYHLGMGRSNILRVLDLPAKNKVLELGAGCGALTRYLGENFRSVDAIEGSLVRAQIAHERCRDLDNVKVFCANFKYIKFDPVYDIVTLIGVLEYAPLYFSEQNNSRDACLDLLKLAKSVLKPNGVLILAIENKIGVKYWSGCPEDHTGKIFDSIHGYPVSSTPITFSKREIETLLKEAGFCSVHFYYCFPDYKFATTVFSDIGDEKDFYLHNWVEVPFVSYSAPRIYTFHEGLAIKTLSEAGLLREFANSFLIVASPNDGSANKPDWVAKRLSIKRKRKLQCVTTLKVKPNIYIEKKRLFGDKEEVIITNENFEVRHNISDSTWYEGDLMIFEVFKAFFEKDFKNKILGLLEVYFQELISRYYLGVNDEEGYPLLRGNSVDFIFRNIIKNGTQLVPIDDEWHIVEYVPADYVVFRCIMVDIIGSQRPWVENKIKNPDKFAIELMKNLFPKYNKYRHNRNKHLEKSFRNLVVGNLDPAILQQKTYFLRRNRVIWYLVEKLWRILPNDLKYKIRKLLIK